VLWCSTSHLRPRDARVTVQVSHGIYMWMTADGEGTEANQKPETRTMSAQAGLQRQSNCELLQPVKGT
jgi:hypothetical protein